VEIRYYTCTDLITTIQLNDNQTKKLKTCSYCNYTTQFEYPLSYKYVINFGALTVFCSETCFNIFVLRIHTVSNNTELGDIIKTYKSVIITLQQANELHRKFKKCII
jgi:hypothetical protein